MDIRARIALLVNAQGAKRAASDIDKVGTSVNKVDDTTKRAGRSLRVADSHASKFRNSLIGVARATKVGIVGFSVLGGWLAKTGVGYDALIEQQQTAFSTLLHSQRKAIAFTADLQQMGAATPFEFTDLATASQRLLAFGFTARQTKKQLLILGDAASSLGGGAEKLQQLSLIFGQIAAKGRLQGDEVLQLAENGVSASQILQKQLGLTASQFQKKLSTGAISADVAIRSLNKGMRQQFAGGMAKQSKTLNGQISTLKDNASQLLGRAIKPLFNFLRTKAVPWLNKLILQFQKGTGTGGKIRAVLIGIGRALRNTAMFVAGLVRDFRQGKPAVVALGVALAALAAGFVAFKIVTTVTRAFRAMQLAVIGVNAAMLANPAGLLIAGLVAIGVALVVAYNKVKWFRNGVNATWSWIRKHWPLLIGPFNVVVQPIVQLIRHFQTLKRVVVDVFNWILEQANKVAGAISSVLSPLKGALSVASGVVGDIGGILPFANGGTVPHSGPMLVGERGPEIVNLRRGDHVTPNHDLRRVAPVGIGGLLGGSGVLELHSHVHLDGREVGHNVRRHALRDLLSESPA